MAGVATVDPTCNVTTSTIAAGKRFFQFSPTFSSFSPLFPVFPQFCVSSAGALLEAGLLSPVGVKKTGEEKAPNTVLAAGKERKPYAQLQPSSQEGWAVAKLKRS